jgi:glycosyltransferase involved in cell wall biosynthesis
LRTKIKIIRIVSRLNIGGPSVNVVLLTAGVDRSRFDSILVCGRENPGEGSMLDYATEHGVVPVTIPEIMGDFRLGRRELRAIVQLYRLIRKERPAIVETHTAKAGFVGRLAARLARVPVVVHIFHGHILDGYFGALKTGLLRQMERTLARMTDAILTVSERVKRDLVTHGVAGPDRIAVMPLGLELEPFLANTRVKGRFRTELGLDGRERLVGIVGRLFPIKNHQLFLEAAELVTRSERQARFVVVGDGTLRLKLEAQARALGIGDRVVFTGWRRDLPSIYADLDLLVISSDNEGTPVVAIEAMASGCPVVATSVGGMPDVVRHGENGVLVPPRSRRELAEGISKILRDQPLRASLGEKARADVRERFDSRRMIADRERLYLGLLAAKDSGREPR